MQLRRFVTVRDQVMFYGKADVMATVIEMPKLSDTMEEGAISNWMVKEGEKIEEGDVLAEIETDKATMEYPSPETGCLLKILVNSGSTCALGAPIAVIGTSEEIKSVDSLLAARKKNVSKEENSKESLVKEKIVDQSNHKQSLDSLSHRVRMSPLARKLAKEQGVDLLQIIGSGPNGRIIKKDIQHQTMMPDSRKGEDKIVVSQMRKSIAKRLSESKQTVPHYYLKISSDATQLLRWREGLNTHKSSGHSKEKVSVNDLLVFVTSRALLQHPVINSSWQGDYIIQNRSVDIAIAVALENGLITPVIKQVEKKSIWEIALTSRLLVQKAKQNKLCPEDYTGGTFTISNLGMTGVEQFTGIINPPQACLLAVGCIKKQVVVSSDQQICIQDQFSVNLSCDHRVVDGYVGAKFLETWVAFIENPALMLS